MSLRTDGHAHPGGLRGLAQRAHQFHQHDLFLQCVEQRRQIGDGMLMCQPRRACHVQFTRTLIIRHAVEGLRQRLRQGADGTIGITRPHTAYVVGGLGQGDPCALRIDLIDQMSEHGHIRQFGDVQNMLGDAPGVGDDHRQQRIDGDRHDFNMP